MVALDSCDPEIALGLAAAGRMPALAALLARGTRAELDHRQGLFPGALWPTLSSGVRADRHLYNCWDEIELATYERRLVDAARNRGVPFWRLPGARPLRLAVIDVPHSLADQPLPGLQISEWGCHDRHAGLSGWPAGTAAAVERRFGLHAIFGLDAHAVRDFAGDDYAHRAGPRRTAAEDALMRQGLLDGLQAKRRLAAALLCEGGPWDLFLVVFGEAHAVGHQLWHVHDPAHPRHDPAQAAILGDPVTLVYERLDAALAELMAEAGADATVLLLLSHGMGPRYDGSHLLDTLLRRLDRSIRGPVPPHALRRLLDQASRGLPATVRRRLAAALLPALRRRLARHEPPRVREYLEAAERAEQRFFMAPNNTVHGGVRLNLAGREPRGRIAAAEADRVAARLRADLRALVNVATGGPVVHELVPASRWYRRSPGDTMPDLFVTWERGAAIEQIWSPQAGLLHAPDRHWRSGDHRPRGLLIAAGPGIGPGGATAAAPLQPEDLTASLAARLGLPTGGMDGRPQPWLAGSG
ncbi:MAG: alkaline phosphatase family protein [Dongiaceae bacterium]